MSFRSLTSKPVHQPVRREHSPFAVVAVVALLTCIGAGLGGMLLALLLHGVQHLAYGYSVVHVISGESFLRGVADTSPERRVTLCGPLSPASAGERSIASEVHS